MSPVALPSVVTHCTTCDRWGKGLRVWRSSGSHTDAALVWELACRCTFSSRVFTPVACWRPDGLDHLTLVHTPFTPREA